MLSDTNFYVSLYTFVNVYYAYLCSAHAHNNEAQNEVKLITQIVFIIYVLSKFVCSLEYVKLKGTELFRINGIDAVGFDTWQT